MRTTRLNMEQLPGQPDHIHVELPCGAMASVSPDAPPEALECLDKMMRCVAESIKASSLGPGASGSPPITVSEAEGSAKVRSAPFAADAAGLRLEIERIKREARLGESAAGREMSRYYDGRCMGYQAALEDVLRLLAAMEKAPLPAASVKGEQRL